MRKVNLLVVQRHQAAENSHCSEWKNLFIFNEKNSTKNSTKKMYPAPSRHPTAGAHQPGQPFKFTVAETCERIKDEFNFLQTQYHSLKLECEKLVSEKTEMQRHYVMYYEMSYGLNVEMHKQTEIAKRLSAILAQIMPFLAQEHQQQVATAVERAKQVTMTELNAIIGQQMHAQQLPHAHAPPIPMVPHPGLQPPSMPPGSIPGLLALSGALSVSAASHLSALKEQHREESKSSSSALTDDRQRSSSSISPNDRDKYRSRSPDPVSESKRRKEEKHLQDSDGEKSDQDLVVDDTNEDPLSPANGEINSRENGQKVPKLERPPSRSGSSSSRSTPSVKSKEGDKPTTPVSKPTTPTNSSNSLPGTSGLKPVTKSSPMGPYPYVALHGAQPGGLPGDFVTSVYTTNMSSVVNSFNGRPGVGYDPHSHVRAPGLAPGLGSMHGGKPYVAYPF